ncbi:MAG: hypothetical protein K0U98_08500 [Deltaproteobacteria bacterium]|nr:hypothetical protein [Deltaproteobacteria bacterium]
MEIQNRPEEIENWDLVVVYDPEDGRVVHTHHTVTWRGGEHPGQEEQERTASEHAEAEAGAELGRVAFLHADPREVDPEAFLRVDPETRSLITEPIVESRA